MKPLIPSIGAVVLAVSTITAHANNTLSTKSLVQEAGLYAEAARNGQQQKRLKSAQNKLERASDKARLIPYTEWKHRLRFQLDSAIDVLKDSRVSTARKIKTTREKTDAAVRLLNNMIRQDRPYNSEFIDESARLVDSALGADRNDNEFRTQRLLEIAIDTLRPFQADGKIAAAISNLQQVRQLFRRNLEEGSRTMQRIRFLARDARALGRNSYSYTSDRPQEFVVGQTPGFKKRQLETEVVTVPSHLRKGVEYLYLLGFNSDLRIREITIHFTDGSIQRTAGRYLTAGVKTVVTLHKDHRGNKKAIRRVAITGRSIESGRHSPQASVRLSAK